MTHRIYDLAPTVDDAIREESEERMYKRHGTSKPHVRTRNAEAPVYEQWLIGMLVHMIDAGASLESIANETGIGPKEVQVVKQWVARVCGGKSAGKERPGRAGLKGRPSVLTDEQIAAIHDLDDCGWMPGKIADVLGVKQTTVEYYTRDKGRA